MNVALLKFIAHEGLPSWSIDFIFGFCEKNDKRTRWHFTWRG